MQPQFNANPLSAESPDAKDPAKVLAWLNKQFARMNSVLRGPHAIARPDTTAAVSIELALADLTQLTLTQDTTITLPTDQVRAGTEGSVELLQDGVGGWKVTWGNAYWPSGTPATVPPAANARVILRFMYDGTSWVSTSSGDVTSGTFTPTMLIAPSSTVTSYTDQVGNYTRIGNRIFFEIRLTINVVGAATGGLQILFNGLPMPGLPDINPVIVRAGGITLAAGWLDGYVFTDSGVTLEIMQFGAPTTAAQATHAILRNGCSFQINGSYRV